MIEFTYDYEIRAFGFVLSYEEKLIIKEYNLASKLSVVISLKEKSFSVAHNLKIITL